VAAVVTIRPARPDDAGPVIGVWAEAWQAAYAGIMPADVLTRATGPDAVARRARELARQLADERCRNGLIVADKGAPGPGDAQGAGGVIGYARFGPERDADGPARLLPATPADGGRAELYAIYVRPQMWSAGAGRALIEAVIERVSALRYATLSLWVLAANSRARRFYERAGFTVTGEIKAENRFAGVTEVRYLRPLG
jgi:ribosomal protein S18 acetylase RimI-like enzyme